MEIISRNLSIFSPGISLIKFNEMMEREQNRLYNEINSLNNKIHVQRTQIEELDKIRSDAESKNKELYKLLDVRIEFDYISCL